MHILFLFIVDCGNAILYFFMRSTTYTHSHFHSTNTHYIILHYHYTFKWLLILVIWFDFFIDTFFAPIRMASSCRTANVER